MATRAQTPRAPRKKAEAPQARKSQRDSANLTSKAGKPQLNPKNTANAPNPQAKILPRNDGMEFDRTKQVPALMTVGQFDTLLAALIREGYDVIGPTARDGAITYERVKSAADLPAGWTDEQEPGRYRLRNRDDQALFASINSVTSRSYSPVTFGPAPTEEQKQVAAECVHCTATEMRAGHSQLRSRVFPVPRTS